MTPGIMTPGGSVRQHRINTMMWVICRYNGIGNITGMCIISLCTSVEHRQCKHGVNVPKQIFISGPDWSVDQPGHRFRAYIL